MGSCRAIVFEAKDGAGNDLVAVTVTMDGQRVTDKLDGLPLQLDPGEHRFTFESEGLPTDGADHRRARGGTGSS